MAQQTYGVDLGTSNFKIVSDSSDKVLNEKNVIAIKNKTEVYDYGDFAYEMYEKAPANIDVSFPVKFGVIADIQNMDILFECFYIIVGESNQEEPYSADNQENVVYVSEVSEQEYRDYYSDEDDYSTHSRSSLFLHLTFKTEVADGLADLLLLQPADDASSREDGYQKGEAERCDGPERQIAEQALSRIIQSDLF